MPVETCQIIALVYSDGYGNSGPIHRADGTSYNTIKGAFRNHPCTQWAALKDSNLAWLIEHGIALCNEYSLRYSKLHGCFVTLEQCKKIFCEITGKTPSEVKTKNNFIRAMPDEWKKNNTINTIQRNAIQPRTVNYDAKQYNTMQYKPIQNHTKRTKAKS
mgnify:CR=1 FL=1